MSFLDLSLRDFSDALASKAAVPGGGGASALVGALGAALGTMVGSLTVGKPKYAAVEAELLALMSETEQLRRELMACADEDAAAFEPLSRAYGLPKDDPDRADIMESCLRAAAAPPMKILRLCCRAIELQKEFAEKGSALMVSDAGTGVVFCRAALDGAALNVKVNTKLMRDREYAAALDNEVSERLEQYRGIADSVYGYVFGRCS
ncbi:MAG: cyclodeaminase/cyclohydrolase family protein [Firmicutes bacterium]|nr:cyclodeaminase/cyclohydrolase family protein [Bacillota bacterium]